MKLPSTRWNNKLDILALDLSLNSTGFAVLEWNSELQKATVLELGHIDNKKQGRMKWSHGQKLHRIYTALGNIQQPYHIDTVVREKGVTRFNKATQAIFRVVGIADLFAYVSLGQTCQEIGITESKKLITGSGKAEKEQVATAVQEYLTAPVEFAVDDESDAVAVGVAYCLKQEEQYA